MIMLNLWEDIFTDPLLVQSVFAITTAGKEIRELSPLFAINEGEGHRSGTTAGDKRSHELVLDWLSSFSPGVKILSEEGGRGGKNNVLDVTNPGDIFKEPAVVIFDPVDGTAAYGNRLGNWSIGVGIMRYGALVGSALYAPALNGGMLIVAEIGKGAHLWEWDMHTSEQCSPVAPGTTLSNAIVALGVDPTIYASVMTLVPDIGSRIRAWALANSGLLGLAHVASGRIQAIIQTPQKPWDWAPAYRAVIESGRVFRFFRLIPDGASSILTPLKEYDLDSFCSLPKVNRLGFVAGEPEIVNHIFDLLPKTGWAQFNPDTVSAPA